MGRSAPPYGGCIAGAVQVCPLAPSRGCNIPEPNTQVHLEQRFFDRFFAKLSTLGNDLFKRENPQLRYLQVHRLARSRQLPGIMPARVSCRRSLRSYDRHWQPVCFPARQSIERFFYRPAYHILALSHYFCLIELNNIFHGYPPCVGMLPLDNSLHALGSPFRLCALCVPDPVFPIHYALPMLDPC